MKKLVGFSGQTFAMEGGSDVMSGGFGRAPVRVSAALAGDGKGRGCNAS